MSILGPLTAIGSGILGINGDDEANNALQQGYGNAEGTVNSDYGTAESLAQPIYNQGLGSLQNLSSTYNSGGFNNPVASQQFQPTQFNAANISSDPEYQAELKQGTNAIMGSSEAQGGLFSGNTDRSLQNYGEQTAAGQENNLEQQNLQNNQFGEAAQNQNFGEQQQNLGTQFQEGSSLASNANAGLGDLSNLYTGQASDIGNLQLGSANAYANKDEQNAGQESAILGGGVNLFDGSNMTGLGSGSQSGLGQMSGLVGPDATDPYSQYMTALQAGLMG